MFKAGGNAVCTFMSQTVGLSKKKKKSSKGQQVCRRSQAFRFPKMFCSTAGSNGNHIEKDIHWVNPKKYVNPK